MTLCAAFDPAGAYATQTLALTECHAQALAHNGYQALAGGGLLTGLLTVLVALIGYRLMLGHAPSVIEGAGLLARVALVLALATQWPAYQTLVFDVTLGAPRGLAGALTGAAGLGAADGAAQMVQVDAVAAQAAQIVALSDPAPAPVRAGLRMIPAPGTPGLPDTVKTPVHWASGVMTATALAGWLSTRVTAAVLLGLGPVLVAGLLFAGTRGLALGWLRGLLGAMLGQVMVAVVVAMELSLAQGQMAGLMGALNAGDAPVAMADGLLTTALVFAAVMLAGLLGVARVASGLAWPERLAGRPMRDPAMAPFVPPVPAMASSLRHAASSSQRVERIAAAAARSTARAIGGQGAIADQRIAITSSGPAAQARDDAPAPVLRLGQSASRRLPRPSRQAAQRDATP